MVHFHEWVPEYIEPWGATNKFLVAGRCKFCRVQGVTLIEQEEIEWDYMEWYTRWHQ